MFRFSACLMFIIFAVAGCQQAGPIKASETVGLDNGSIPGSAATQPNTATLWVHGMGCPQCAYNVDLQLLKVPGVEKVKVDMSSGKVVAKLSPDNPPTREQLSRAIEQTGFTLVKIEMQ